MAKSAKLSLLTTIFALTAFVLYLVGAMRCDFVKFTSNVLGTSSPLTIEFGIWYYQALATVATTEGVYIVEYCQGYPDTVVIDASWKAARAFGILVFIFSCIVVAALLYTSCFPARAGIKFGRLMPPLYLLMAIFQGLTLLFLDSTACKANPLLSGLGSFVWPETCAISTGAKCYISATVFWAAAAFSSFNEQMALEAELTETDSDLQTGLLYDP